MFPIPTSRVVCTLLRAACRKQPLLKYAGVRSHWIKDYKPAPYPLTFEERLQSANRYNLPIEDYVPYEGGDLYGDYPKLPDICDDSKDVFYPWDNPELKRNFNETLHVEATMYGEDRYDVDKVKTMQVPLMQQLAQLVAMCTLLLALMLIFENWKMFPALAAKQYPHQGKMHFTFEPCSEED